MKGDGLSEEETKETDSREGKKNRETTMLFLWFYREYNRASYNFQSISDATIRE